MATDDNVQTAREAQIIGILRLIVGAVQGAALYFLYHASEMHTWPATNGLIFAPLLFVALFIPLGISLSLGNLRAVTLAVWAAIASVVVAGIAHYGVWKMLPDWHEIGVDAFVPVPHILPSFGAFFFTGVFLFIAHALIAGGDAGRRLVARYHTHFDVAWKLALQLALGAAFVGVFWGLLWLGAELFNLIQLDFLQKLIEHEWFAIPATALAAAASVHLTDVRAGLVRGIRTLALVLLGWFLPLLTLIAAGFLAALLFTGLEPLWQTRHASVYLLTAAGILVILINAAYQDGDDERRPNRILRFAGSLAALVLVPLVALAAYALTLRVDEYGWTADRVATAACIVVAVCYAAGYAFAAVFSGTWLKRIERWNFVSAVLILAVVAAVFSPLADPDRIGVDSQVARLESGRIPPDKFDYDYLHSQSGRYGLTVLRKLATSASGKYAAEIRSRARKLLDTNILGESPKAGTADKAANITVYPKGQTLPADFLKQDWNKVQYPDLYPACIRRAGTSCDAYPLNLSGGVTPEIVIMSDSQQGMVFAKDSGGVWRAVGLPGPLWNCASVIAGLRAGHVTITTPAAPHWKDVTVNGALLTILPPYDQTPSCPK